MCGSGAAEGAPLSPGLRLGTRALTAGGLSAPHTDDRSQSHVNSHTQKTEKQARGIPHAHFVGLRAWIERAHVSRRAPAHRWSPQRSITVNIGCEETWLTAMPHTVFESARLYGARTAFATTRGFLLDEQPRVLALDSLQALEIPGLGSIGPPETYPELHGRKRRPELARAFNPSIALAPRGLCPRCTYAVTLRVDTLHQCDSASSPYTHGQPRLSGSNWFQGTVVGILDVELRLLGWTWLLNSPTYQIASADYNASTARRAGCVSAGAADGFPPVWAKQV